QLVERVAQLVVGVADLQADVIQADAAALGDRRRTLADLDEQKLVMGASAREGGGGEGEVAGHALPAEQVAVEGGGALEVAHVEDDVAELLDLHVGQDTPAPQAALVAKVSVGVTSTIDGRTSPRTSSGMRSASTGGLTRYPCSSAQPRTAR